MKLVVLLLQWWIPLYPPHLEVYLACYRLTVTVWPVGKGRKEGRKEGRKASQQVRIRDFERLNMGEEM